MRNFAHVPLKSIHPLHRPKTVIPFIEFLLRLGGADSVIDHNAMSILKLGSEEQRLSHANMSHFFPSRDAPNIFAWPDILSQLPEEAYILSMALGQPWETFYSRLIEDVLVKLDLTDNDSFAILETETGYLGKGPLEIKIRDRICASEDVDISFAIQKKGLKFFLVGSCYVTGISDREAREMIAAGKILVEEIPLS